MSVQPSLAQAHSRYFAELDDNKRQRRVLRITARAALIRLLPGEVCRIELPPDEPARRDCYIAVNSVAHDVFGKGNYSVCKDGTAVLVTRAGLSS